VLQVSDIEMLILPPGQLIARPPGYLIAKIQSKLLTQYACQCLGDPLQYTPGSTTRQTDIVLLSVEHRSDARPNHSAAI